MIWREVSQNDSRAERASWVERSSSVEYSEQLGDEKSQSTTHELRRQQTSTQGLLRRPYIPMGARKVAFDFSAARRRLLSEIKGQ